jgi:hypothetical protein
MAKHQRKEDDAMATVMTPSAEQKAMTDGQIDKAVANYRALLVKYAPEFPSEPAQVVLGQPELAKEMVAAFRRRVEAISSMIYREIEVDISRAPQQVLDATGRRQYIERVAVDAMPRGRSGKIKLGFFELDLNDRNGVISDDDLAKEFELRNLELHPYALSLYNLADPAFADEHPNGCPYKGADGLWYFVTFRYWRGGRRVYCFRSSDRWCDYWQFGGACK